MKKRIRSEQKQQFVHDPFSDDVREVHTDQTEHSVADDGSIESQFATVERPGVCGCIGNAAGGICGICQKISCAECHGFCMVCHKPVCPRDAEFPNGAGDRATRFCADCWATHRRRGLLRGLGRLLIAPFVRIEDQSDGL